MGVWFFWASWFALLPWDLTAQVREDVVAPRDRKALRSSPQTVCRVIGAALSVFGVRSLQVTSRDVIPRYGVPLQVDPGQSPQGARHVAGHPL